MLTKRQKNPNLVLVTHDHTVLERRHQKTILKAENWTDGMSLQGLAMTEENGTKIWINPELVPFTTYLTVAHELAHVFVGPYRGHSAIWRSFYIRLIRHFDHNFADHYDHPIFRLSGVRSVRLDGFASGVMKRYTRNDWQGNRDEVAKILSYADCESDKIEYVVRNIFA